MFTQRLKISVVFTLKFHANCIHKTSFKSFTTSKNFHCTVPFPSLSQIYHTSSCFCCIWELKGHIWTRCEKTFLSGNLLYLGEGTLNQLVVLLPVFFGPCSFLCKDEEEALLLLSFGSKCILGCDWISPQLSTAIFTLLCSTCNLPYLREMGIKLLYSDLLAMCLV